MIFLYCIGGLIEFDMSYFLLLFWLFVGMFVRGLGLGILIVVVWVFVELDLFVEEGREGGGGLSGFLVKYSY